MEYVHKCSYTFWLLFCVYGSASQHKQLLKAERVYSDAHFKDKVHHGREVQMFLPHPHSERRDL